MWNQFLSKTDSLVVHVPPGMSLEMANVIGKKHAFMKYILCALYTKQLVLEKFFY